MRALGASRTSLVPGGVLAGPWVRDPLWRNARAVPSLDLRFADNKSLTDAVTGASLVTFTRASSKTVTNSARVLETVGIDVPAFDHNPTTGESLGLLVEEQRTNGLLYSEDTSQWLAPVNITLSQNQTTAPNDTSTADQYLETAATGLHAQESPAFTFVTSTVYTYSVFVKSIGNRNFEIGYPSIIFTGRFARFNLSGSGSVQGSDAGVTASIQAYANGWYRCSATNTCVLGGSSRIVNFINNDSFARSYAGDVTKGLFIWGADLQAGAFPTSYIPTTTAAVTRSADVCSITGSAFSSWYRQDEGTMFADIVGFPIASGAFPRIVELSDGTSNNFIRLQQYSSNLVRTSISTGNVGQMGQDGGTIAQGVRGRVALAVATNDCAFVVNAGTPSADSSVTVPVVITQANILSGLSGSNAANSTIRRLTFWPTRLPNTTLQAVTQ
jgi:hypothetical protein